MQQTAVHFYYRDSSCDRCAQEHYVYRFRMQRKDDPDQYLRYHVYQQHGREAPFYDKVRGHREQYEHNEQEQSASVSFVGSMLQDHIP